MFRTDSKISWRANLALGLLPFVLLVCLYAWGAWQVRHQDSESGTATASSKLLPTPTEMVAGMRTMIEPDAKGERRFFVDTLASLRRFALGMSLVSLGVLLGVLMGCFPHIEANWKMFHVFWDKVPPLLLLPILFLVFDIGEFSKIALVVLGVFPGIVLDAYERARAIPREQFYKAQSLGASEAEIPWSIVLPQIMPQVLGTIRLNFKAAWCYVIAAESIAASEGLGYRIFIMRRYMAMDVILPYVIWATLLMFALDFAFQWLEARYQWTEK